MQEHQGRLPLPGRRSGISFEVSEEGGWESALERGEKDLRKEVSSAVARVLRYEDDKKVWYTQSELSTNLTGMKRVQNEVEGVLQTMVRDVIQDGAGP